MSTTVTVKAGIWKKCDQFNADSCTDNGQWFEKHNTTILHVHTVRFNFDKGSDKSEGIMFCAPSNIDLCKEHRTQHMARIDRLLKKVDQNGVGFASGVNETTGLTMNDKLFMIESVFILYGD